MKCSRRKVVKGELILAFKKLQEICCLMYLALQTFWCPFLSHFIFKLRLIEAFYPALCHTQDHRNLLNLALFCTILPYHAQSCRILTILPSCISLLNPAYKTEIDKRNPLTFSEIRHVIWSRLFNKIIPNF